ncbi:hypothetical protein RM51_00290 [Chryseobacterium taiwanense]|uniref:Secretion system C-terminal sorting domain-containing protein n=1 Tax=Chryseobacterium taiwanense TaxID=363331 RepID=A0A0B4D839_9FLAO|nr:hypothetical protein RM51_00290 [Chryseobacterium taiwanense]
MKITAQSYEQLYSQEEQARLTRVSSTEAEIDGFIDQYIGTYDFTKVINMVNQIKDENGQALTGSAYQGELLSAKKARLRNLYFEENPEKLNNYYAKQLQRCVNGGFEDNGGSVNGYSFAHNKISTGWSIFNNNPTTPIAASPTAHATLVDNSIPDPIIVGGILQRVNTGTRAIRIGNPYSTDPYLYHVTKMTRTFTVNESSISFAFALVLQDGGSVHVTSNTNPYYQVKLLNSNNQPIFTRNVMANPTNPLFQKDNGVLYTNWACENINTANLIGQTVTLEIILSDCGQGGHWGYGYFDDFCGFTCTNPAFNPGITLNPLPRDCPKFPLPVSGNITLPSNASFTNVTIQVLDTSNNVVGTKIITSAPAGAFSTNLDYSDFYPSGPNNNQDFNIKATLNYTISGIPQTPVVINNTNPPGPDVSFKSCPNPCLEAITFEKDQPITTSQNFQASCCIISSSIIYPNLTVDFRAAFEIILKEGFYVSGYNTGNFHAYIAPCEDNSNISSQQSSSSRLANKVTPEFVENSDIKIYPNPASNYINITSENEKLISWEIYDMSGKSVLKGNTTSIDVQNILKGSYLLKINLEKKQVSKIIIIK